MAQRDVVEINIDIGEDFAAQLYWVDEFNNPIDVIAPCRMDAKDAEGEVVLSFRTGNTAADESTITLGGQGFIQLTSPKSVTAELEPGSYVCDLFATVNNNSVFEDQEVKVFSGYVIAYPRTTVMES
jgi:hypothetical protein